MGKYVSDETSNKLIKNKTAHNKKMDTDLILKYLMFH